MKRIPVSLFIALVVAVLIFAPLAVLQSNEDAEEASMRAEAQSEANYRLIGEGQRVIDQIDLALEKVTANGKFIRGTQRALVQAWQNLRIDCQGVGEVLACKLIAPALEIVRTEVVNREGETKVIRKVICKLPNGKKCPKPKKTTP